MVDVVSHVVKQLLLLMFYSYLRLYTHLKVRNIFVLNYLKILKSSRYISRYCGYSHGESSFK